MALDLNSDQFGILVNKLTNLAILHNEGMSEKRLEVYIATLMQCPKLNTFDRIVRAIDMASWQLKDFPSPSELNNMFQNL